MKGNDHKSARIGRGRGAFTLIELLVVIGILGLLMALLMPAVSRVIERGRVAGCQSNLRQMGAAFFLYATDNEGQMPGKQWFRGWGYKPYSSPTPQIAHYLGLNPTRGAGSDIRNFPCPSFPVRYRHLDAAPYWHLGYSYNNNWHHNLPAPRQVSSASQPTETFLVMDGVGSVYWANITQPIGDFWMVRHGDYEPSGHYKTHTEGTVANVVFADGRVQYLTYGAAPLLTRADVARYARVSK